jgi:ribosomal protein L11 methyltransferase
MPVNASSQGYFEISIIVPAEHEEMFSDFIIEQIAFGLVTEELDNAVKIICYIPLDNNPQIKIDKIKQHLSRLNIFPENTEDEKIGIKKIKDIDWIAQYQKEFKPVFLDDLVIKTPWDENDYPGKKIITIEPKMAFGTGKHETTQLCLEALRREVCPGMKVLDLGTGSGILSIYAAMLGAEELLGLDIDPEAIPNALENARINDVDQHFSARTGSMEQVRVRHYYDLVISNLIREGIIELFDRFVEVLKPGGTMILSGILDEQNEEMLDLFRRGISADIEIMRLNEWLCYILRTK